MTTPRKLPRSLRRRLRLRWSGLCLATLIVVASMSPAWTQTPAPAVTQAPKPANIDRNGVLILIRSALLALDHANRTGNYTVLRDLGAPGFQTNSAAKLAEIFAKQRNDNLDLSGVAAIDPQLSLLPQIEANGLMHMAGFFPSIPSQVNFELAFAPVNGQWRLFGISVSIGQTAPAAPQAPEQPVAQNNGKPAPEKPVTPAAARATPVRAAPNGNQIQPSRDQPSKDQPSKDQPSR